MPYSPLTDDRVFRYVFGEPEGLPLLESLINAFFEPVGIPKIHHLTLQNREVGPTDHLGFVFVELRKLLRLVSEDPQYQNRASPDLKNAAIWGTFLEKPEKNWVIDQNAVAEMLLATRIRMEEFMALTPEIVYEIQKEMYEHDLASMRGEARRAGLAEGREEGRVARSMEIARNLKVKGMSPVEIAELTGLPIPAIESL